MTTDVYKKALEKFDVNNPLSWAGFFEIITKYNKENPSFKDLLKTPQDFLENLYNMAIYYYSQKNYPLSLQIFNVLYAYDSKNPKYSFGIGACEQGLGNGSKSLCYYLISSCFDPLNPEPLYYAAELSLSGKKDDAAHYFFKKVIELAKDQKQYAAIKNRSEAILMGSKKK